MNLDISFLLPHLPLNVVVCGPCWHPKRDTCLWMLSVRTGGGLENKRIQGTRVPISLWFSYYLIYRRIVQKRFRQLMSKSLRRLCLSFFHVATEINSSQKRKIFVGVDIKFLVLNSQSTVKNRWSFTRKFLYARLGRKKSFHLAHFQPLSPTAACHPSPEHFALIAVNVVRLCLAPKRQMEKYEIINNEAEKISGRHQKEQPKTAENSASLHRFRRSTLHAPWIRHARYSLPRFSLLCFHGLVWRYSVHCYCGFPSTGTSPGFILIRSHWERNETHFLHLSACVHQPVLPFSILFNVFLQFFTSFCFFVSF